MRSIQRFAAFAAAAALVVGVPNLGLADDKEKEKVEDVDVNVDMDEPKVDIDVDEAEEVEMSDERERAMEAADVLKDMVQGEDAEIPEYLLERAHAVAVIPDMVKGAIMIGGRYGEGLVSQRLADGTWSAPMYVEIGGASYGLQLGVESTDLVLVFTEEGGLEGLLEDKVKLGADISVAAGPVGRKAQAGTNITLDSPIYAYSRTQGLFAGISLDGAVLSVDHGANEAVYGKDLPAKHFLKGDKKLTVADDAMPFWRALNEYVPPLES